MIAILLNFISLGLAGVSIRCFFGYFDYPQPVGLTYTCNNAIVTLSEDGSKIVTEILGSHPTGKTHFDVNGIRITSQSYVTFLPQNLQSFFPNLTCIETSNTNLQQITQRELRPFPKLEFYKAYGGSLTTINGNLFRHNPKLRYISFNTNLIKSVGADLVTYLDNLSNLYFSGNECINKYNETRDGVLELNALLPQRCPPVTCSDPCIFQIEELEEDVEDLMAEVRELKQTLQETNEKLEATVNNYEKTIKILKDQLKRYQPKG